MGKLRQTKTALQKQKQNNEHERSQKDEENQVRIHSTKKSQTASCLSRDMKLFVAICAKPFNLNRGAEGGVLMKAEGEGERGTDRTTENEMEREGNIGWDSGVIHR
jgi:hypothetical protein